MLILSCNHCSLLWTLNGFCFFFFIFDTVPFNFESCYSWFWSKYVSLQLDKTFKSISVSDLVAVYFQKPSYFCFTGNCWTSQGWFIRVSDFIKTYKIVYKTMVRPVIVYGAKTWAVKEEQVKKLRRSNKTRERKYKIRKDLKVAELTEKIRESTLRWYGHVKRINTSSSDGLRSGTRTTKDGWVRDDGRVVGLDAVNDRIEWRKVSRGPHPLQGTNGMMTKTQI